MLTPNHVRLCGALASACAVLSGCAAEPAWNESMGAYRVEEIAYAAPVSLEKRVLRALAATEASATARGAVLAAFDAMQQQSAPLLLERRQLEQALLTAPPASSAADALQKRLAALNTRQAAAYVGFHQAAAAALPPEQYQQFSRALERANREGGFARNPRE